MGMLQLFRKKRLKRVSLLALVLLGGLFLSRIWSPGISVGPAFSITAFEASAHVGKTAEVCGRVASTAYLQQERGQPVFLNFERPYPDQVFTAVIWGENRAAWNDPPEILYNQKNICVSGRIASHQGIPQVVVRHPRSVRMRE